MGFGSLFLLLSIWRATHNLIAQDQFSWSFVLPLSDYNSKHHNVWRNWFLIFKSMTLNWQTHDEATHRAFLLVHLPLKLILFSTFWLAISTKHINDLNWLILIWCSSNSYFEWNVVKEACQSTSVLLKLHFHWPPNAIDSAVENVEFCKSIVPYWGDLNKGAMCNQTITPIDFKFLFNHLQCGEGNLKIIKNKMQSIILHRRGKQNSFPFHLIVDIHRDSF